MGLDRVFHTLRRMMVLLAVAWHLPLQGLEAQAVRLSGSATLTEIVRPFSGFSAGTVSYEFVIPANAPPSFFDEVLVGYDGLVGRFTQGNRTIAERGDISFFVEEFGGGFLFAGNDGVLLNIAGPQLFTGPSGNPRFRTGTIAISNLDEPPPLLTAQRALTLNAVTPVPEPSSPLLLAGAPLLLVWIGRRRRQRLTR